MCLYGQTLHFHVSTPPPPPFIFSVFLMTNMERFCPLPMNTKFIERLKRILFIILPRCMLISVCVTSTVGLAWANLVDPSPLWLNGVPIHSYPWYPFKSHSQICKLPDHLAKSGVAKQDNWKAWIWFEFLCFGYNFYSDVTSFWFFFHWIESRSHPCINCY